jgi:hypothetical protein
LIPVFLTTFLSLTQIQTNLTQFDVQLSEYLVHASVALDILSIYTKTVSVHHSFTSISYSGLYHASFIRDLKNIIYISHKILRIVYISGWGTGKKNWIAKKGYQNKNYSQKKGLEKNCDLNTLTGSKIFSVHIIRYNSCPVSHCESKILFQSQAKWSYN